MPRLCATALVVAFGFAHSRRVAVLQRVAPCVGVAVVIKPIAGIAYHRVGAQETCQFRVVNPSVHVYQAKLVKMFMQGVAAVNDMMRERVALRPVRRAAAVAPRVVAVTLIRLAAHVGERQQVLLIVAESVECRVLVLGSHVYGG